MAVLMDNYSQIIDDLDEDFLNDFLEQVLEEISDIEANLTFVHLSSDIEDKINAVYESIQRIEMLCRVGFLDPLTSFMKHIENTIDGIRLGRVPVNEDLVEVLLLMFDILRHSSHDMVALHSLDVQLLEEIGGKISEINQANEENRQSLLLETIHRYSFLSKEGSVYCSFGEPSVDGLISDKFSKDKHLVRFLELAEALEFRFSHWKNRNAKILNTGILINNQMGGVVDTRQLTAAIYLHDLGMALLPDELIYKKGKYGPEDIMLMQNHPHHAYAILDGFPDFEAAAIMVLQHHEWYNGNGYPCGIRYGEVCVGAQIISIADTFYSLTHKRADRDYNRSVTRSLSEINRGMGTQFDPSVVAALNAVSDQLFLHLTD